VNNYSCVERERGTFFKDTLQRDRKMRCILLIIVVLSLVAGVPSYNTASNMAADSSNEYEVYTDLEPSSSGVEDKSLEPGTTLGSKPLLPLEFWESAKRRPRGKHLKAVRLAKKMGDDFNPTWMSVERPAGGTYNLKVSLPEATVAELMEQVTDLDIESDIRQLLGENEEHRHEPTVSRAVGAFQQWLIKKSSCPVLFQWADLGEYFWPRYVRQGECQSKEKKGGDGSAAAGAGGSSSCSWPRGMSCNPADAEVLQLLRWHCSRRKTPDLLGLTVRQKIRKTYKCRWIKVPYPVTSSCRCE
jgi:noggin